MSGNFYDDESLTASFVELKKLLDFLQELGTPRPAITGGWAVYAYEGGLKSRDIDIVMASEEDAIQQLHHNFFPKYNYTVKKDDLFSSHWEKIVKTSDGDKDIIVDVFYGDKKWKDEVYLGLEFEWDWTLKFQEDLEIDGLKIIVPKRELLIITKMMAAVARTKEYDLTRHYRLPSKISKDYKDVARLTIGKELDLDFYKEYVQKSKADKYLDDFLSKYKQPEYGGILKDFGSTYQDIESILKI
ncbi:MAG: hypothetical protein OEM28_11635 [Nitrosopumilus sp.]|nr:hypothetical protein [Nitrosopumilus sp.]MDH3488481.1 hypothetical protein [Nitrosopumilus sp.]